eukprot:4280886-Amphidinium_carterae.1
MCGTRSFRASLSHEAMILSRACSALRRGARRTDILIYPTEDDPCGGDDDGRYMCKLLTKFLEEKAQGCEEDQRLEKYQREFACHLQHASARVSCHGPMGLTTCDEECDASFKIGFTSCAS